MGQFGEEWMTELSLHNIIIYSYIRMEINHRINELNAEISHVRHDNSRCYCIIGIILVITIVILLL